MRYLGLDGRSVDRISDKFPYSYDEFVRFKRGYKSNDEVVYSDRLHQWDSEKYDKCCLEVFGNTGQYFSNRKIDDIQKFLRMYFDDESLIITAVTQACNVSNGYPYWGFYYRKSVGKSVGDLETQLQFLVKELSESYKTVWSTLQKAKSISEASNAVLLKFEKPADQSESVQAKRTGYGEGYYEKYAEVKSASTFTPRLSRPTKGNVYYNTKVNGGISTAIKGSPVDPDCDVLSNCVGYALGRFNEIGGYGAIKYLKSVNAENFMDNKGSCKSGMTPKLGACIVWQKGDILSGSYGAGHVAIVEQIISDTKIVTSESGWGSSTPFWTKTRSKGDGNWGGGSGYKFLGFIYNPAVPDGTVDLKYF
jgi:hypothetical protein